MQVDFHLGVTFIIARMSGFTPSEAQIIAASSQFVDDAIHSGTLLFQNRSAYQFISSAHRHLDYRNFKELANHFVWIPFHFIPGNQMSSFDSHAELDPFIQRLICRPNSHPAHQVLDYALLHYQKKFGLHLLGVASHAFIDTWAHQGFAGIDHEINRVETIFDLNGNPDLLRLANRDRFFRWGHHRPWYRKLLDKAKIQIADIANPVGHGPALSYPDLPFLRWSYKDFCGETILRDNPKDFFEAIQSLYSFYVRLRRHHKLTVPNSSLQNWQILRQSIEQFTQEEGQDRLLAWKQLIEQAAFDFGRDVWIYNIEGPQSWIFQALGFSHESDFKYENLPFDPQFFDSNWKNMNDALLFHRHFVLNELLPAHQMCVA